MAPATRAVVPSHGRYCQSNADSSPSPARQPFRRPPPPPPPLRAGSRRPVSLTLATPLRPAADLLDETAGAHSMPSSPLDQGLSTTTASAFPPLGGSTAHLAQRATAPPLEPLRLSSPTTFDVRRGGGAGTARPTRQGRLSRWASLAAINITVHRGVHPPPPPAAPPPPPPMSVPSVTESPSLWSSPLTTPPSGAGGGHDNNVSRLHRARDEFVRSRHLSLSIPEGVVGAGVANISGPASPVLSAEAATRSPSASPSPPPPPLGRSRSVSPLRAPWLSAHAAVRLSAGARQRDGASGGAHIMDDDASNPGDCSATNSGRLSGDSGGSPSADSPTAGSAVTAEDGLGGDHRTATAKQSFLTRHSVSLSALPSLSAAAGVSVLTALPDSPRSASSEVTTQAEGRSAARDTFEQRTTPSRFPSLAPLSSAEIACAALPPPPSPPPPVSPPPREMTGGGADRTPRDGRSGEPDLPTEPDSNQHRTASSPKPEASAVAAGAGDAETTEERLARIVEQHRQAIEEEVFRQPSELLRQVCPQRSPVVHKCAFKIAC